MKNQKKPSCWLDPSKAGAGTEVDQISVWLWLFSYNHLNFAFPPFLFRFKIKSWIHQIQFSVRFLLMNSKHVFIFNHRNRPMVDPLWHPKVYRLPIPCITKSLFNHSYALLAVHCVMINWGEYCLGFWSEQSVRTRQTTILT